VCLRLCTGSVRNTTQNSSDNLPSYLQTNIIAQMLSIGGEGALQLGILTTTMNVSILTIYCGCSWDGHVGSGRRQEVGWRSNFNEVTSSHHTLATSFVTHHYDIHGAGSPIHRVPKKLSRFVFVRTSSNFHKFR